MKNISDELKADLAESPLTVTLCWAFSLPNKPDSMGMPTYFRMTALDRPVEVAGYVYRPYMGGEVSAITVAINESTGAPDIVIIMDEITIKSSDVRMGFWDDAQLDIFLVNYKNPEHGIMEFPSGWLGDIQIDGQVMKAPILTLQNKLEFQLGDIYTITCRAKLGDKTGDPLFGEENLCKLDLQQEGIYKFSNNIVETVDATYPRNKFSCTSLVKESGFFNYGMLVFTGQEENQNKNLPMEVKVWQNVSGVRWFTMFLDFPYDIAVGDVFKVYIGCDKLWATCVTKFANWINFRGHPYIPGQNLTYGYKTFGPTIYEELFVKKS